MKGYSFHIHRYPAFIHRLILQFIFSYPITSLRIHTYPNISFDIHKDIHVLILEYPSTYPVISMVLPYSISLDIHTDILVLIHEYPSTDPSDIHSISQDILSSNIQSHPCVSIDIHIYPSISTKISMYLSLNIHLLIQ